MSGPIERKRKELLDYVSEFQRADDRMGGVHHANDTCREWLDKLFRLNTELAGLEAAESMRNRTHSFSVDISKGDRPFPHGVKKQ